MFIIVVGGQTHVQTDVAVPQATYLYMFTWPDNCVFLLAGHDDFDYALK